MTNTFRLSKPTEIFSIIATQSPDLIDSDDSEAEYESASDDLVDSTDDAPNQSTSDDRGRYRTKRALFPASLRQSRKDNLKHLEYPVSRRRLSRNSPNYDDLEFNFLQTYPLALHGNSKHMQADEFDYLDLCDFTLYESPHTKTTTAGMMDLLHNIDFHQGKRTFLFDGILRDGDNDVYVKGMEITRVGLDFGESGRHSMKHNLSLQTSSGHSNRNIWYWLVRPAPEYFIWHMKSEWVIDFIKHTLDFIFRQISTRKDVTLSDFECKFISELKYCHATSPDFRDWHDACGKLTDFRKHVNRHSELLLHKTILCASGDWEPKQVKDLSLWRQICPTD